MTGPTRRVVVVGGGVVGLCAAYYLRKFGHDVIVCDPGRPRDAASYGNAGMLMPIDSAPLPGPGVMREVIASLLSPDGPIRLSPLAAPRLAPWLIEFMRNCTSDKQQRGLKSTAALADRSLTLYDSLANDGVDFEMHFDAPMAVFAHLSSARRHLEELKAMKPFGYTVGDAVMTRAEVLQHEASLTGSAARFGFLIPGQRHLIPITLLRGLRAKLATMGVVLESGTAVTGFKTNDRSVLEVATSRGDAIAGDTVLIAAGAWTKGLAKLLGASLPIEAGKGYSFSVSLPAVPGRSLYLAEARIACTPMNGRLRLSGTMELSGTNLKLRRHRVNAIARGAEEYLPGSAVSAKGDVWTGMRPITPDGLPIIGPLPGWKNVFVAAGHGMLGVTLAPPTGQAIAETISNDRVPALLEPFHPARFTR